MSSIGKTLIVAGAVLLILGVLFLLGDRMPVLGKLPGDIRIRGEKFTLYVPVATCILLSIILTIVANVVTRLFFQGC